MAQNIGAEMDFVPLLGFTILTPPHTGVFHKNIDFTALQIMLHRLTGRHNAIQIGQIALNQNDFGSVKPFADELLSRLSSFFQISAKHENGRAPMQQAIGGLFSNAAIGTGHHCPFTVKPRQVGAF